MGNVGFPYVGAMRVVNCGVSRTVLSVQEALCVGSLWWSFVGVPCRVYRIWVHCGVKCVPPCGSIVRAPVRYRWWYLWGDL
jgi:hypothetical protein